MRSYAQLLLFLVPLLSQAQQTTATGAVLGFDRNDYPGDETLATLKKTFAYTGYWLNPPPGEHTNTWVGKRAKIEAAGFGFLVLFNGKLYNQIRTHASALGTQDGKAAVRAAEKEGFAKGVIIFLDQEQGGRLLPEQRAYLFAWIDTVIAAGYRAGVYCSGQPADEGDGTSVVTAADLREHAGARDISYWVTNDACRPSPGCVFTSPPAPPASGVVFASVWQFAQSPRRKELTASCANTYAPDGECYAPGIDPKKQLHIDLNSANSPDPSQGRHDRK